MERNLKHLTRYAINYFKGLLKKYGAGKERKTQIDTFDSIDATSVVMNNQKLYVNREEGFIGYGLKKDEYVCDCSDIDDIIVFRNDGKYSVCKIADKVFVGKDIVHVAVYNKESKEVVYNAAFRDGKTGITRVKRFKVPNFIRDKDYDITLGNPKSKLLYFSVNPNAETELVEVRLTATSKAKNKLLQYDFANIEVKGKTAQGNILTKYPVRSVRLKKKNTQNQKEEKDLQIF